MKNIINGFWYYILGRVFPYEKGRLEICNVCAPEHELCPVCKCFIEAKVKVKSEKCPKGLWQ